jgi:predicted small secreted protein
MGKRDRRSSDMKKIVFLFLLSAIALGGCNSFGSKKDKKDAAVKKRAKAELRDENADVDFQAFVGRLKKAVAAHDANTLASMMTQDFAYVLGATAAEDRKGEGVFKYWDENGLWTELDAILTERFVKKGEFWVTPPQFADESLHYDGYRVGIRRVGGSWKFVYFVNG